MDRRGTRVGAVVALCTAVVVTGAVTPARGAAGCVTPWGSLAKEVAPLGPGPGPGGGAGRPACYDRLVVDVAGPAPGFHVAYVPVVLQDPTGVPMPLAGGAFLEVVVRAPAHRDDGTPAFVPGDP